MPNNTEKVVAALQQFFILSHNVLAETRNAHKGNKYAKTEDVIAALKPIAATCGIGIHIIPGEFVGAKQIMLGENDYDIFGTITMHVIITHISGQMLDYNDFGAMPSFPLNIKNKGMTLADRTMSAMTILTRRIWLGLAGAAETTTVENSEDNEYLVLGDILNTLKNQETIEAVRTAYLSMRPRINPLDLPGVIEFATGLKNKFGAANEPT